MARRSLRSDGISTEHDRPSEARLLNTLQELLELPALEPREALDAASQLLVAVLGCEKIDIFLLDEARQTLCAVGTSKTEMGRRQQALGLDKLPLANGGRIVEVFKTAGSFLSAHADEDPLELVGIVTGLGARSTVSAAFSVGGVNRGVLAAVSANPEFFGESDLRFVETVARCIGMLTHRAELAERVRVTERQQARRLGADEIITVLAHDLRNHLHPLVARLQLVRLKLTRGQGVESAEIDKALRAARRLAGMTDNLLDLRRLDEGLFSLAVEPVDLVELANDAATSLGTADVPVHVRARDELVIVGDPERLRQVIENLVANAVKYSPHGQSVQISVHAGDEDRAIVEVCDEGPGIAPELLPTVFERFTSTPGSPGLGLGLYLARRIACEHGGDLNVDSVLGRGTRFRLELPLAPP